MERPSQLIYVSKTMLFQICTGMNPQDYLDAQLRYLIARKYNKYKDTQQPNWLLNIFDIHE